ncbi:uncharacterized protein LOC109703783 [Ananas comosus]|uniref:Uncharacterized protein LOC109703783 n=1 Tax=Ananas comosus TaxID=4615 RepID=A0A6P5EAJ9_ANACO|nr:uncharacterized protein LOC109703783 [Ananas comosus]
MASAGDAVSLSTSTMSDAGDDEGDNVIAPANWLSLPWDLLARILSRLTCSVHYLRAVVACKQWADAPLPTPDHLPVQPPIAFFSEFSSRGPYYNPATGIYRYFPGPPLDSYCFGTSHGWLLLLSPNSFIHTFNPVTYERICRGPYYNPATGIYSCLRGLPLDSYCFGTSHGWLLVLGSNSSIYTVNVITYNYVGLPPLLTAPANMLQFNAETYPHYRVFSDPPGDQEVHGAVPVMVRRRDLIRLSVLSSDPAEDPNFTVLIVLNHITNKYLYCRKGTDAAWAPITLPLADFQCSDLAPTRNKKIYAVDGKKEALIAFDLSDPAGSIAVSSYTISGVPRLPSPDATFLLESADGSLLLVNKIWEVRAAQYDAVLVVFRLDLSAPPQARALPVADIGASNALFVCEGESRCVDVSAFPRAFSPNHIYFFRPFYGYKAGQAFEAETIGIFSLEKGELTADSHRLPRGWPCVILGKVRWLFFNLRFIQR